MKIWIGGCTALLVIFGVTSCSSITRQSKNTKILDASQESDMEGTGTSSADLRAMAERMAQEIAALEWPNQNSRVRIAITTINTEEIRFPINPHLIEDRLLTDLIEFSAGTRLQFTQNENNADYLLSARLTALSKGTRDGVVDYLQYTFRLIDRAENILWARMYETKKQGKTGVMYR